MQDKLLGRLESLNTKDCLWTYILRILEDGPTHAYSLRGEIRKRYGFTPGAVTAYRVLYHLTGRGFVRKKAVGRRKVYEITEKGRAELGKAAEFYERQSKALSV